MSCVCVCVLLTLIHVLIYMYDMSTVAFFVQLLHAQEKSCVFVFVKVGIDVLYNWFAHACKVSSVFAGVRG